MISFIVTTYNLEDWLLRRCLSSIVAQGLAREEYEIVVVDDESVMSPQNVVDEFVELANITLYVQTHARQGAARNLALSHAKGEWIQFIDGDDYLFEGTIASLLHSADTDNLDLLMFGFREVQDESAIRNCAGNNCRLLTLNKSIGITTGNSYMIHHNLFGACWAFLFRRQLLDDLEFGEVLRFTEGIYIEDEEFVTKLVWRARRVLYIDVPVYAYYQRVGSTVHIRNNQHTDELFHNYFVVLRRLLDFEESLASTPHEGVIRKVRFLAMDILRRALREPDWKNRWNESARHLYSLGLYPLPATDYSWKYSIFRLLARCDMGRHILRTIEKRK